MSRLVVVSNRVALPKGRQHSQGGLAVAMEAAMRQAGGLWFGWDGQVDDARAQEATRLQEHENIKYATVSLSHRDYQDYYAGFANRMLWPLFHYRMNFIHSHRQYQEAYFRVNHDFAQRLTAMLQDDDLIWVHDYHFLPLAAELRKMNITQPIGFFLHTPFPSWDVMRALPGHEELLEALCAYDLIGFQTRIDQDNFLECIRQAKIAQVQGNWIKRGHRRSWVEAFPIGVDVDEVAATAKKGRPSVAGKRLQSSLSGRRLIMGVDRLDYSKGLSERFQAYENLLDHHAERRREVVFMQIAPPTRADVPEYNEIRRTLERNAGHINGRFADYDWVPLRYLNRGFNRSTILGFLSMAQVGLVTPLRDGMNLVAKEYVAAQNPQDPGVLVLSHLAGAAQELDAAVVVNPYDIDDVTAGLQRALSMQNEERKERWLAMMAILRRNNIHVWRERFLHRLQTLATNDDLMVTR